MTTDELSTLSDVEVIGLQFENREWGRVLRQRLADLVSSRMANEITFEEYSASRTVAKGDRAECDRRTAALSAEMRRRGN